jgi:hypothetical protein
MRRRTLFLTLAILAIGDAAIAQPGPQPTPEAVVRAYTEAANRHDLEAFLALYAPDIRKYRFPGELASEGLEHARAAYTKSFAEKSDIKVEIVEMITLGDKVVSHDRVTGRPDGKIADELTVYQVKDGRIANIVYVDQVLH